MFTRKKAQNVKKWQKNCSSTKNCVEMYEKTERKKLHENLANFFPWIKGNLQIYIKNLLFQLEVEIALKLVTRKNTGAYDCIC
jgi:uncharacterized FlaG/YvyC family protein